MSERGKWGAVWIGWAVYFTAAEAAALRSKHPDAPLSAHLRWVLGVHKGSKIGFTTFAGFFGWLGWHLWRQGR